MDTPKELMKRGFMVFDTDLDHDVTGIMLPLNTGNRPMCGTLTVMSEDSCGEDYDIIQDTIRRQPEAAPYGAYKVKVQIYCGDTDKLVVMPGYYGLDVIAAVVELLEDNEVKLEWG